MKLYYDIETGDRFDPPIEIPDIASPILKDKNGKPLHKIIIIGTMSEDNHLDRLKEMFYNPTSYKLIEYGSKE